MRVNCFLAVFWKHRLLCKPSHLRAIKYQPLGVFSYSVLCFLKGYQLLVFWWVNKHRILLCLSSSSHKSTIFFFSSVIIRLRYLSIIIELLIFFFPSDASVCTNSLKWLSQLKKIGHSGAELNRHSPLEVVDWRGHHFIKHIYAEI